jgi:hypothetical protein
VDDLIDEDWELRKSLSAFDPEWIRELEFVLNAPEDFREELERYLIVRPDLSDLAQLLAMVDTDKVVRLRLLRAIRDIEASSSHAKEASRTRHTAAVYPNSRVVRVLETGPGAWLSSVRGNLAPSTPVGSTPGPVHSLSRRQLP